MKKSPGIMERLRYFLFVHRLRKQMNRFNDGIAWVDSETQEGETISNLLDYLNAMQKPNKSPDVFDLGAYYRIDQLQKEEPL